MLLATDLDGTFLAGDLAARQKLYRLIAHHPDIQLAYVSGRGREAIIPLLSDPLLPAPDFIICDVGATVLDGATLQPLQPLHNRIDAKWPGDQVVDRAFGKFDALQRQPTPQRRRCAYFCPKQAVTDELRQTAENLNCEICFSQGKYLDVLGKGVSKGATLRGLIEQLGIESDTVLVAGDSMQDLSMMQQGFKSVCVKGSEKDLLRQTKRDAQVLHAEHKGCGGILDALVHFGFLGPKGLSALEAPIQEPGSSELVIVYHRLPYEEATENGRVVRRRHASPNGIIPTLLSFFADEDGQQRRGAWVAWSVQENKRAAFERHTPVDVERYPNVVTSRVALSKHEVDVFYKRFSKEAFWPTLHTFWERARFREDHWQVFQKVNKDFAEATAAEAAPGAIVWIHDYNLWMVPAYLRELRPDLRIAFFHHTYFPSADVFNVIPWRREIIGSLLMCDYVAFHIPRQVENFVDVARGVAPLEVVEKVACAPRFLTYGCAVGMDQMTTLVKFHDRHVQLGAHPVGLDVERVRQLLASEPVKRKMAQLREDLRGLKLIMAVERLDYTKGILEKLNAFERMLTDHPELQGRVTLITICVPAAKEMKVYATLQSQIEQAVGRINGKFARVGWVPLQFFFRSVPFEEVVAYYAVTDVMWVSPLRDGLNLVAKEFVAAQGLTDGRGVLVLSEFAGAAAELKGAVLCNPHDPLDLAQSCYLGLSLGKAESQSRLRTMFDVVCHYDIKRWGRDFLSSVGNHPALTKKPEPAGQ